LYGKVSRPSVPIRTIVGLLLLKQMYGLENETIVARCLENPYWQHFCGEVYSQYNLPFDPSDFVHFRKHIGEEGMKNITFPTDRKLTEKVIEHCNRIAKKEDIKLKRTYTFKIRKLKQKLCFARKPKNFKKHIKAIIVI